MQPLYKLMKHRLELKWTSFVVPKGIEEEGRRDSEKSDINKAVERNKLALEEVNYKIENTSRMPF